MTLRHPDSLRHLTIEDCFGVDGTPALLLSDGTILTVWCDEEQNGPGVLYAQRPNDGLVEAAASDWRPALIHPDAPAPTPEQVADQRISSLATRSKMEAAEQLDRMLSIGRGEEPDEVFEARRLVSTHRGPTS